jgi:hypothetical protein
MDRGRRTLRSNGVELPFDDDLFTPLPDSTALLDDPPALRRRFREQGALRLRGLLDRDEVVRLRASYLSTLPEGMIAPGTPVAEGVFSGRVPDMPAHGVAGHPAHAFVRSREFDAFTDHPALSRLAEALLGGPADRLPRCILRHFHSGEGRASRAHTDYAYMDQGSEQVVTMWIPVGDCPVETGGLVYLEGSHTLPAEALAPLRERTDRPGDTRPISHDLGWTARSLGRRWLWADYEAGDVNVHGPHIVHASLDTLTERMRISADVRFVRSGAAVDTRWSRRWAGDDGA